LGSSSDKPPKPETCRIYYQNINGISSSISTKVVEIFRAAAERQISILALAETNTNWLKSQTQNSIIKKSSLFWTQITCSWSEATTPTTTDYQP
jgi:hypothetical protein